ncbi:hypothetical protein BDF19DRAFT_415168 [Syncephalis fuscata]|nr:hypothetical protein BDF19DRAFT_415168 [Syncephalis fuscata]
MDIQDRMPIHGVKVNMLYFLSIILFIVLHIDVQCVNADFSTSGVRVAIPLRSGLEPLDAIRGRLRTPTMDVTVTFYSGGSLPYGRVYISSRRIDPNDRAVYLIKLHENALSDSIDLSAGVAGTSNTTSVGYCQHINRVYDPDFRYPNQPQQVIPAGTGEAPIVSLASLNAWDGMPDDGKPFKATDFVPDRENIVNTWRTVSRPPVVSSSESSTRYKCFPGHFGSCMLGDLSASLNATLQPPIANLTLPKLTLSLHPRLETRQGARAFVNFSLALHRQNEPQVVHACTNLAPVDTQLEPEPDFFSFSATNERWYIASERDRFVGRMISRGILSIVLYFALSNAINSSILLNRDRGNPARWLLVMLTAGVLMAHLPLIPQLLVGDGDSEDQIVPCKVIRAIGLITGYLGTGAVAGILMVKAYYGHKRAYWVAVVGIGVEIVVVALLTYNAVRVYALDVKHLPNDGCLAPYMLFGISIETFYSKIVIDVLSNLVCSGLFLAVVMRHRCTMASNAARVYDALARDGLIYLVCACASSVFCPLLYVSQAMPPYITNALYSVDYVVASTLIVQQLLRGEAVRQQRKAEAAAMTIAANKRSTPSAKRTQRFNAKNTTGSNKSGLSNSGSSEGQRTHRPTFASNFALGRKANRDSDISLWTDLGTHNAYYSVTDTNLSCLNEEELDNAVDMAVRLKERERAASNLLSPSRYPDSPRSLVTMATVSTVEAPPPAYEATPGEQTSSGNLRQRLRDSVTSRKTKYLSALSFIRPLNTQRSFETTATDEIQVIESESVNETGSKAASSKRSASYEQQE